jgi:predicted transcriptional regulator
LVENLKLNRKTAGNYLKTLEELAILTSENKGKEVIYVNTKLYELLKRGY